MSRKPNSFTLRETKDNITKVSVETYDYDDFKEWMPFVGFDKKFLESWPMQTSFYFNTHRKEEVIRIMCGHGYVQGK